MNGYHCFNFTEKKTFLQSVDRKQPSNFHFDLSLKLSQVSGEVQNDLRGGAHVPTPPLKIRPWTRELYAALLELLRCVTCYYFRGFCAVIKFLQNNPC
jgi:hypothetical protein